MPLIGAGLVQNSGQVAADETEKMDSQRMVSCDDFRRFVSTTKGSNRADSKEHSKTKIQLIK